MIASITTLLWFNDSALETGKLRTSIFKNGTIEIAQMRAAFDSTSS